jgi:hypothetical protein
MSTEKRKQIIHSILQGIQEMRQTGKTYVNYIYERKAQKFDEMLVPLMSATFNELFDLTDKKKEKIDFSEIDVIKRLSHNLRAEEWLKRADKADLQTSILAKARSVEERTGSKREGF